MKKKKVFLYARVSTSDQKKGLEAQLRALKQYCHNKGITEYEIFADENQSGAKSSRPSLDRMMSIIKDNEVDSVVVYSLSRLARSVTHLLKALEVFDKHDVSFTSLTEHIDTKTPSGRAILTILGAISQLERELIAERVRNGLANARAKGVHIGRKKTRNSALIRALLKKKLSYRAIAELAECSHGSIYAEKVAWLKEKKEQETKIENAKLSKNNEDSKRIDSTNDNVNPSFEGTQDNSQSHSNISQNNIIEFKPRQPNEEKDDPPDPSVS